MTAGPLAERPVTASMCFSSTTTVCRRFRTSAQAVSMSAGKADGTERFSVTREELMSIVKDAVRNTKRRW